MVVVVVAVVVVLEAVAEGLCSLALICLSSLALSLPERPEDAETRECILLYIIGITFYVA